MPEETNPLDIMFSGSDEEPEVVETVVEEPVVEEPTEEVEEIEEVEVEVEDEEEIDYDKVEEKPKEEEPEEEVIPESKAVERARIEGKRRKELELEKKEWELERDRIQNERDEYERRLKEFESTKIKPTEHPDFIAMRDEILKDVKEEVDDLESDNADDIYKNLGGYIERYRKADAADAMSKFKDEVASELFEGTDTWDELERDDRRVVNAAIKLIKKSTGKADKLEDLRNSLEERANKGILAVGVKEYERNAAEFQPILDAVGDLSDEIIEANPYAIESAVARIAKTDKKRLESAKKDVFEIMNGLRPLTQEELEKLNANGTDVKAFQLQRQKALVEKKKKLAALLIQGLVTRSSYKEMAQELAELKQQKDSEESEDAALRKVHKKKAPQKKEVKPINPIDIMFGGV